MGRTGVLLAGIGTALLSPAGAKAQCTGASPSSLQNSYPAIGAGAAAALAPALSDVAAMASAEVGARSAAVTQTQRLERLDRMVADYDARRQQQRRPMNFRNGQSLLRSLIQPGPTDPPQIASARAELKAARRGQAAGGAADTGVSADADVRLAAAIDRLTREASSGGSYRMLVDADRLVRDRVSDCAAWRGAGGAALPRSLAALDRYDQAMRGALSTAAIRVAPQVKAEIAAAGDSATLDRVARDYMPTAAGVAAMEVAGVAQVLAARRVSVAGRERTALAAAQGQRAADAARAERTRAAEQARADAADRALLARQRSAQGGSRTVAADGGGAVRGEPSEAQMRTALQTNASRVADRLGMSDWTRISAFEKVGCEKAQGRIGWQCDYVMRMDGNPTTGLLDALGGAGTGMRGSARFVLRPHGWDAFPEQGN